jgi:membrane protein EpsK
MKKRHKMQVAVSKPQDNLWIEASPKGRLSFNLLANLTNFTLNILIGLWLVPYLIRHLGIAAYGLVPLAISMIFYMEIFTIALNSAVGRFMTLAMDRQDYDDANRIFNTSFWCSLTGVVLLLGPGLWLTSQVRFFFNVPLGYEEQFARLFFFVILVFLLTTLRSPFNVASFCRNRFELSNAVAIAETVVRVSIIILLFTLFVPQVWYMGLAMLCASGFGFFLSLMVWRYLMPMLAVRWSDFSRQTLKELTGMGIWMFISHIGNILFFGIDLLVVNKMLGTEAGGKYGAIMIWSNALRALAGVLSGVFTPTIISLYGQQDTPELLAYARKSVKFVGLLMALPIGLICGLAQPLLHIWLGPSFETLAPLMILMSIHLCVNLATMPLIGVMVATNRVSLNGLLTCLMGAGNLGLAVWLSGPAGWGMYGVAAAGAIMLTAKNLLFTSSYSAHLLNLPFHIFFRELLPIVLATTGTIIAAKLITSIIDITGWFTLIGTVGGISITFIISTYLGILTREEKNVILSKINYRHFLINKIFETNEDR